MDTLEIILLIILLAFTVRAWYIVYVGAMAIKGTIQAIFKDTERDY